MDRKRELEKEYEKLVIALADMCRRHPGKVDEIARLRYQIGACNTALSRLFRLEKEDK
jgi:hypothetical protein